MELKKGMYVRSEDYGIGKVISVCTCEECEKRGFYEPIIEFADFTDYVTSYNYMQTYEGKASPNIIDLIELGDILKIYDEEYGEYYYAEVVNCSANDDDYTYHVINYEGNEFKKITDVNIKSIVTKEQFESMEYKIGDK